MALSQSIDISNTDTVRLQRSVCDGTHMSAVLMEHFANTIAYKLLELFPLTRVVKNFNRNLTQFGPFDC